MAVSTQFGLCAVAIAVTLAVGACGDGGGKAEDDKDSGGGSMDAGGNGGPTGSDGGLLPPIEFAELEDDVAGSPCTSTDDCKGKGAFCNGVVCTGLCESNTNCGAGGTCVQPIPGAPGECNKVCQSKADCASSLDCREGYDLDDLIAPIREAGFSLDAGIDVRNIPKTCGEALNTVSLPDGVVGIACTGNTQCAPGECETEVNLVEPFPNGYCSGKCLVDSECGAGGVCYINPLAALLKSAGVCLLGCSTSATCRPGQVCRSSQFIDAKTYCLPAPPDAGTNMGGAQDAGVDAAATNDT